MEMKRVFCEVRTEFLSTKLDELSGIKAMTGLQLLYSYVLLGKKIVTSASVSATD
jgi:hypothetical protein